MAVTSIWRVNGWLGKVVVYVENPDKTTNPEFYENRDMPERDCQDLDEVISYAVSSHKTQQVNEELDNLERFVSGINCNPSTAREEMMAVKKRFGKEDGTIAYHGYQSFAPGEATPEIAHQIGVELARRLWGERYQVVVATHLDKANHLHNHFVLNTVSFVDGKKYFRSAKDYHDLQATSDALCREYGLSVIEHPQPGKGKHYGEWRAEQEQRPTWRGIVRSDVDEVIRQSMTEQQFLRTSTARATRSRLARISPSDHRGRSALSGLPGTLERATLWMASAGGFWNSPERCAPCRSLPPNANTIVCLVTGRPVKGDWVPGIVFSLLLSAGGISTAEKAES